MARSKAHSEVPSWRRSLQALRETHIALCRLAPYRDDGLVPRPSASPDEIEDVEFRLGVKLPRAYREFLTYSNGWPRLFGGASLLGTQELGSSELQQAARLLLAQSLPDGVLDDRFIVPFGVDAQRTTLFAFDYTRGGREPAVLAWVFEFGVQSESFVAFLEFVLSLSRRDLAAATDAETLVSKRLRVSAA